LYYNREVTKEEVERVVRVMQNSHDYEDETYVDSFLNAQNETNEH
jgi:hypothetical protein